MDKRKKTAVTIVMTCILILIMALVIMYRIKENNSKDYTKYENQNTKETSTIQSSKIGLQRKDIEKIWNDSALEENRQEKEFYRFEFPMYRGESVEEVFSLYFRFYVSCEDGEYYLDPRIIFGGFYNVSDIKDDKISKEFTILSDKESLKFNIFKDEKKSADDGNTYNAMAFSTENIDEFEKIVKSKNVNIKITLDNRKFVFDLGKDEKKKLHSLISDYKKLEEKVCDDKQ